MRLSAYVFSLLADFTISWHYTTDFEKKLSTKSKNFSKECDRKSSISWRPKYVFLEKKTAWFWQNTIFTNQNIVNLL